MSLIGIVMTILSHVAAGLYMQKLKYNKFITACFWIAYAVAVMCPVLLGKNVVIGFFVFFVLHFIVFYLTTEGSIGENTFLFLTYANSFCICIGATCMLSAYLGDSKFLLVYEIGILLLIHIFLYKVLIPTYRKSKVFFPSGWWKLNIVLVLFLAQFLNQYAFKIVDKNSANDLLFNFVMFSIIFYSILIILFNLVRDVAEKNKKTIENDELKNIAYIDALTNIKNRTAYEKYAKKQIIKHRKNTDAKISFVILDIDGFKNINDTKGHAAGDEILKQVAEFINQYFESFNCESFRIGGDEFVLLLDKMPLSEVEEQIEKMNKDMGVSIGVTMSYGCSEVDFNNPKPFNDALTTADRIMYSNKQQKKRRV